MGQGGQEVWQDAQGGIRASMSALHACGAVLASVPADATTSRGARLECAPAYVVFA